MPRNLHCTQQGIRPVSSQQSQSKLNHAQHLAAGSTGLYFTEGFCYMGMSEDAGLWYTSLKT